MSDIGYLVAAYLVTGVALGSYLMILLKRARRDR